VAVGVSMSAIAGTEVVDRKRDGGGDGGGRAGGGVCREGTRRRYTDTPHTHAYARKCVCVRACMRVCSIKLLMHLYINLYIRCRPEYGILIPSRCLVGEHCMDELVHERA
jgi:hypothetical protein